MRLGFLPQWLNMYAPVFGGGFWDEAIKTYLTEQACNINPFALKKLIDAHQRRILR